MRQVDQRQRRVELRVDLLGRVGDPLRRLDRRRRPPEPEQRELAQLGLQPVAQVTGLRVAVGDLAPVGRVHRPRRHRHVRRRVHREPPAEVRAGDVRRRLPHLRRLHEPVRLLPQAHLHRVAEQPAVADGAVPAGRQAGQIGALHGRRHGRCDAAERHCGAGVGELLQARRGVAQQLRGQRDGAQDDGLGWHQVRSPGSWSEERSWPGRRRGRSPPPRRCLPHRPRPARRRWRCRRSGARRRHRSYAARARARARSPPTAGTRQAAARRPGPAAPWPSTRPARARPAPASARRCRRPRPWRPG